MFKIVAVIFAVVNGVPADRPSQVITYEAKDFETMEECMAFPKTQEGMVLRDGVNKYVMSQGGAIMIRIGCVKAEDNTI
jgi:hypothetical protein